MKILIANDLQSLHLKEVIFSNNNNDEDVEFETTSSSHITILFLDNTNTLAFLSIVQFISTLNLLLISKEISTSAIISNFMSYHINFDDIDT